MKSPRILAFFMIGWLLTGAFSAAAPEQRKNIVAREAFSDTSTNEYCGWFAMKVYATGTGVVYRTLDKSGNVRRLSIKHARMNVAFTNLDNGRSVWTRSIDMKEVNTSDNGVLLEAPKARIWRVVLPDDSWVGVKVGRFEMRISVGDAGTLYVDSRLDKGSQIDELCKLLE